MILSKQDILQNKEKYIKEIKVGKIFIYPTDTIYGIGCNALNDTSVKIIRGLKRRPVNPLSVIVPNKEWIIENCELDVKYLDKLPGPYTFVCKTKEKIVPKDINPGIDSIGVRIPDSWFTKILQEADVPFVTTSVNITLQPNMTTLKDLEESIKNNVDYIVYEGKKIGKPSTIIDFTKKNIEITKR